MIEVIGQAPTRDPLVAQRVAAAASAAVCDLVVAFPGLGCDADATWSRLIAADRPGDDRPALVHLAGELGGIMRWAAQLQASTPAEDRPSPPIWPWQEVERQDAAEEGAKPFTRPLPANRERALLWWLDARLRRPPSGDPWPRAWRPWPVWAWAIVWRRPLEDAERRAILQIVGEASFPA